MSLQWVPLIAALCAICRGELTASEERELDEIQKVVDANSERCQQDPTARCNGYGAIVKDGRVHEDGSLRLVADKPYRRCDYLLTRNIWELDGENLATVQIYEVGEEPRLLTPSERDGVVKWLDAAMPATPISSVWEHFEVFADKSFTCKVNNCDLHFSPPLRSTTAMRHLGRKHPEIYDNVVKKEETRKGGVKEEEKSADENEPVIKKNRSTTNANGKVLIGKAHVLQATSAENVQAMPCEAQPSKCAVAEKKHQRVPNKAMPQTIPNDNGSTTKEALNAPTTEQGSVAKEKHTESWQTAMPKEAPTTRKEVVFKCAQSDSKAMPDTAREGYTPETKMKRKAAVEAEKRIAHVNEWLRRVRKEQKEVRAKRTAVRANSQEVQEDDDARYPVDLILDERWIDGRRELLLRWANYDANADTWEPVDHLAGAAELLAAFDEGMDDGFDEEIVDDE